MAYKFHRSISLERLEKFTSDTYFADVNLHSCLVRKRSESAVHLEAYTVPNLERISFKDAKAAEGYKDAVVGQKFGPTWATVWFRVKCQVPADWADEHVMLQWDADNEAMVWSTDGRPLQGLTGGKGWDRHAEFIICDNAQGGEVVDLYIEMACNTMFGAGKDGMINAPDPERYFVLKTAELICIDKEAWNVFYDFQIIAGMAKEMPADSQRGAEALVCANKIIDAFHIDNRASWKDASEVARRFLMKQSASTHRVTAIGHCHIDTAWLWPYDETKRKCARSWSTQLDLMDRYPEYRFACSQAQQFEWIEQLYPGLFERIKLKAKSGQFIPIGGTWVEMDCNIPSGESFVRQFLYGQRFMKKHFGAAADTFWLPDTFGYAGQLPQICHNADIRYFLTQKLSWNNINKFPHTTFYWAGIDGTRILTHFPPGDTYCGQANVKEALFAVKNHKDKEYSNSSLMVFGNGDGGGGPLPAMLERLSRMHDVDGLPVVQCGDPNDFFRRVEKESGRNLLEWRGELYFELHRGTYTSQALTKKLNRKCELLLRDVELLSVIAQKSEITFQYPKGELDRLWKLVLLNQFHDVLPGSSIEMVYQDSTRFYQDVVSSASKLKDAALAHIVATQTKSDRKEATHKTLVLNTSPFDRTEILDVEKGELAVISIPAFSLGPISATTQKIEPASIKAIADGYVLENLFCRVTVGNSGEVSSYFDKTECRYVIVQGQRGNRFVMFEDIPLFWDSWDVEVYHLDKRYDIPAEASIRINESGPLRVSLLVERKISATSSMKQVITLTAISPRLDFDTEIDWNENRRFLKVEFALNIHSDYATYETAYGWVQRPTHFNTSWDLAKFEVCGHKFADLSEYGYGAAILNDCKYGYSTHGNIMRLSLLRAPKAPDAHCDIGHHQFKYALFPHAGSFQSSNAVVREAANFNIPLNAVMCHIGTPDHKCSVMQYFTVTSGGGNVVLDCVKRAEDSNDVILRFYEACGGRCNATLNSHWLMESVTMVNTLEEPLADAAISLAADSSSFTFNIKPFQVLTFKAKFK